MVWFVAVVVVVAAVVVVVIVVVVGLAEINPTSILIVNQGYDFFTTMMVQ